MYNSIERYFIIGVLALGLTTTLLAEDPTDDPTVIDDTELGGDDIPSGDLPDDDMPDNELPDGDVPEMDTPSVDPLRVESLAEGFGVDPLLVEGMRVESSMGWGEIENSLSFAERIALDPENPRAIDEVANELLAARAEGRGWGEIAKDYDLKWGQAIGDRRSGKFKPPEDVEDPMIDDPLVDDPSIEEPKLVEKPMRAARLDKPSKPEKLEKPEKPEKPEKFEKPNKPEKPEKPEKVSKPDKPEKPNKPGKPDKPEKPGRGLGR